MNDMDRILKLAGLSTDVAEGSYNETKMVCKDCGDELHNPTTNCPHDSHDENGEHWVEVDIDGDGDADLKVNMEGADCDCDCGESPCKACGKTHHDESMDEAVGDSAACFYDMQDEFAGGEAEGAHKVLIDELVRYLSGDQLEDFCDDFKRHHDMGVEEGNAYIGAVRKAKAAGMKKGDKVKGPDGKEITLEEPRREALPGDGSYLDTFIDLYSDEEEMIRNAIKMGGGDAKKSSYAIRKISGEDEFANMLKAAMHMDTFIKHYPEAEDLAREAWQATNGDLSAMSDYMDDHAHEHNGPDQDVTDALDWFGLHSLELPSMKNEGRMKDSVIHDSETMSKEEFAKKHGKELADEMYESVVSEAPTMDTTQLITLLKNAGLTEEAIEQKLTEWANTPDGAGEEEPTAHGEAYEFAQSVNLSLKKYLDAQDMKVQVSEHKVEDMKALYESKKNK